jgi:DNA topoisomerase-1
MQHFQSATQAKRNIVKAIEAVAGMLGNTPTICRKCYIHPEIFEAYTDRTLPRSKGSSTIRPVPNRLRDFHRMEPAVLSLLRRRLSRVPQRRTA